MSLELVRLLQLASPALPVGAYSYSQGLESAIETGIVRDASSAERWIGDVLALSVGSMEAPILLRLIAGWKKEIGDVPPFPLTESILGDGGTSPISFWNEAFIASRETSELRAETLQMGYSLRRLIRELDMEKAEALDSLEEIAYPTAFAFAAAAWRIEPREALAAYLFAWIENQVLAAVKAIPLGQTDGQRLVRDLAARIPGIVDRALELEDDALCNFAPGLALASARHETQYSRIFRS